MIQSASKRFVHAFSVGLARLMISAIFLWSAYYQLTHFNAMSRYIAVHDVMLPQVLLMLSIVVQIVGGGSVLLGYHSRKGALLLIAYLIPVTIIVHPPIVEDTRQFTEFLKNLAIIGALVQFSVQGTGPWSIRS